MVVLVLALTLLLMVIIVPVYVVLRVHNVKLIIDHVNPTFVGIMVSFSFLYFFTNILVSLRYM